MILNQVNILSQVAGRMQLGRSAQMRMRGMAMQSRLPELSVGSWSRVCSIALSSNFLQFPSLARSTVRSWIIASPENESAVSHDERTREVGDG